MKNQATLQPQSQCWTRRYEQLREQVLARDTLKDTLTGTDARGLSLLIRQGVAAWMRVWRDPLSCRCAPDLEAESRPMIPPEAWQQEATQLLVNIGY